MSSMLGSYCVVGRFPFRVFVSQFVPLIFVHSQIDLFLCVAGAGRTVTTRFCFLVRGGSGLATHRWQPYWHGRSGVRKCCCNSRIRSQ